MIIDIQSFQTSLIQMTIHLLTIDSGAFSFWLIAARDSKWPHNRTWGYVMNAQLRTFSEPL